MTGDPLYLDGVDLTDLGIMLIKVLVAFTFLLVATMFMVWFERKTDSFGAQRQKSFNYIAGLHHCA